MHFQTKPENTYSLNFLSGAGADGSMCKSTCSTSLRVRSHHIKSQVWWGVSVIPCIAMVRQEVETEHPRSSPEAPWLACLNIQHRNTRQERSYLQQGERWGLRPKAVLWSLNMCHESVHLTYQHTHILSLSIDTCTHKILTCPLIQISKRKARRYIKYRNDSGTCS